MLKWVFFLLTFRMTDSNKCAGRRVEDVWFPPQTPYSRRAFTWIKQCNLANQLMALEKHVCMSSCKRFLNVFWNEKWELFRKDVCYIKKLTKQFFEACVCKKQKTQSVCSDSSLEFWYAIRAYLLTPAYISRVFTLVWAGTHLGQKSIFISPSWYFMKILLFSLNENTISWIYIVQKNSLMHTVGYILALSWVTLLETVVSVFKETNADPPIFIR